MPEGNCRSHNFQFPALPVHPRPLLGLIPHPILQELGIVVWQHSWERKFLPANSEAHPSVNKRKNKIFCDKTAPLGEIPAGGSCRTKSPPKFSGMGVLGYFLGTGGAVGALQDRAENFSPSGTQSGSSKSPECDTLELFNQLIIPAVDISINLFNFCFHRSCLAGNQTVIPW